MQNAKSLLKVLYLGHHFRQRLHLREHINKRLGVIQSGQNLLCQCFLDVVHSFLFGCCGLGSWVLFGLKLRDGSLELVDQVCVCTLNLRFLFNSKSGKRLSGSFCLDSCLRSGLHSRLDLGLNLSLSFNLGTNLNKASGWGSMRRFKL